jgi:signal transduction histidine kinase
MKHSEATEAHLKMSASGGIFEITLEDNGRGFSLDAVAASKRHGLRNIKTRTEEVGGTLQILSTLGKGTSVRIRVPLMTDGKS